MSGVVGALSCAEVRDLAGGFVLDALEAGEMDAVRAHLASCADGHAEIAELAAGLPALWETTPLVEPPPALKSRLLAAAAADLRTAPHAGPAEASREVVDRANLPEGSVAPRIGDSRDPEPPRITEYAPRPGTRGSARRTAQAAATGVPRPARVRATLAWATALAAVLAIALLGAWNLQLQGQVGSLRSEQELLAAVIRAGSIAGSRTAVLAPAEAGGPAGLAALGADGTLVLAMRDLPRTSGSQVYQAWVIVPGSAPAPTGSFQVGDEHVGSLTATAAPVAPAAVVAITREPGPGATTPTLPILASGTATAPTN